VDLEVFFCMEVLNKILRPIFGQTGAFHINSNSHKSGDCPCKQLTSAISVWTAAETNDLASLISRVDSNNSLASKFDAYGYTALHYAAQQNHIKIVIYLLSKGCPPDASSCGATPLHRAAYTGSVESCKLLLEAGADPNAIDSSFRDMGSPLHKAYSIASVEVVELLLKNGANPLLTDSAGRIPELLLKERYLHLFPNVIRAAKVIESSIDSDCNSKEDRNYFFSDGKAAGSISEEAEREESITAKSIEQVDTSRTRSKIEEAPIGLKCPRCLIECINFSRLADGSLLCKDCKYAER
jgi:ankyrin repeat protein